MATSVSVATCTVNMTWSQTVNVIRFVLEITNSHVEDCGAIKYIVQVTENRLKEDI